MKLLPDPPKNEAVERWIAQENMQLGEYLEAEGKQPTEAEKPIIQREEILKKYR